MTTAQTILWIPSSAPDAGERTLHALLSDYRIVESPDLAHLAELVETEGVDAVVAHFPGQALAADLFDSLTAARLHLPVFVRDREATLAAAVALAKLGASQVYEAAFDPEEAAYQIQFSLEDSTGRKRRTEEPPWRKLLVGESRPMQKISELVRLVAGRRCTILITGETGTGKEMVARAIHAASPRSRLPMVAVNCSAIPETLLEAELFGHVKGAFTGAQQLRIGRFEQADGSTLFLDEIGDMPLDLQAKLLRVLQEREFQRLGSGETIRVDVRIVAASNADLLQKVREGSFREDLYYRLNVVPVQTPPLRTRLGDIPSLVDHFIGKICLHEGMARKQCSAEALAKLSAYSWPGNVRQLENAVEMAVIMSGERGVLSGRDFPLLEAPGQEPTLPPTESIAVPDHGLDFEKTVSQFERSILSQALQRTKGNKKLAADMLRLKRTTLSAKVRTLEIAGGFPLM